MTPRQSLRVVAEDTSPSAAPQPPSAAPERPRTLPPWWEYAAPPPPKVDLGAVEMPVVPANDAEVQ